LFVASTLALGVAGAGCEGKEMNPPSVDMAGGGTDEVCANNNNVLSGKIAKSCKLTADRRWRLMGQVTVPEGVTLTIEPGTTVVGTFGTPVSFLLVDRGGKLMAEGTKDKPILFTSEKAAGERAPGDWGGVVLKGHAHLNLPGGEGELEGDAGKYGGLANPNNDDSSGSLRYVRIEFVGRIIAANNELNGLTLGAVGRGTKIEYVQVHQGLDDGFEWFGGTVDVKHLVASSGQDDGFDWDFGYSGRGQFLVHQQYLPDGNNGIEADNNATNNDLTPRSNPTFYNMTLVGTGRASAPMAQKRFGMTLRRGTAGKLHNLIVTGYKDAGVVLTEDSTVQQMMSGALDLTHSIFFGNGADDTKNVYDPAQSGLPRDPADPNKAFDVKAWLLSAARMNREVDPQLTRPFDTATPDFRPAAGSPALVGAKAPPQDGFFESVSYVGAFDATNDWLAGWTAFPAN
jgi:hypothetical protein